jgi:hypothetical protein
MGFTAFISLPKEVVVGRFLNREYWFDGKHGNH